jgi:tetratricopeptide (TPR) repeat protein
MATKNKSKNRNRAKQLAAKRKRRQKRLAAKTKPIAAHSPEAAPVLIWDEDPLDELSNSVVDLLDEQRFDEAEAACKLLLERFPEVPDGLERFAMLHEARGEHDLAADYYRKTLAFIDDPRYADGFEEASREYYRDKIARMHALAALEHD